MNTLDKSVMKLSVLSYCPPISLHLVLDHEESVRAIEQHHAPALEYISWPGTIKVDLDDFPELAPIRVQLDELLARYGIPLRLILGHDSDSNLALWIEPGGPTLLSWEDCWRYFFADAEPLSADLHIPGRLTWPPRDANLDIADRSDEPPMPDFNLDVPRDRLCAACGAVALERTRDDQ